MSGQPGERLRELEHLGVQRFARLPGDNLFEMGGAIIAGDLELRAHNLNRLTDDDRFPNSRQRPIASKVRPVLHVEYLLKNGLRCEWDFIAAAEGDRFHDPVIRGRQQLYDSSEHAFVSYDA